MAESSVDVRGDTVVPSALCSSSSYFLSFVSKTTVCVIDLHWSERFKEKKGKCGFRDTNSNLN